MPAAASAWQSGKSCRYRRRQSCRILPMLCSGMKQCESTHSSLSGRDSEYSNTLGLKVVWNIAYFLSSQFFHFLHSITLPCHPSFVFLCLVCSCLWNLDAILGNISMCIRLPAMESNKATRNHNVGNPLSKEHQLICARFIFSCALNSGLPTLWFRVASGHRFPDKLDNNCVRNSHKHYLGDGDWALHGGSPTFMISAWCLQDNGKWIPKTNTKNKNCNSSCVGSCAFSLLRLLARLLACVLCVWLCACVFLFVFLLLGLCVWLFVSLLACMLACSGGLFARERKRKGNKKRLLKLNVSQHPNLLLFVFYCEWL